MAIKKRVKKVMSLTNIIIMIMVSFSISYFIHEYDKPMIPLASAEEKKLGCCIDRNEGTFDKNVAQGNCKGEWVENPTCNVPGADNGCCILGEDSLMTTEAHCQKRATTMGISEEWTNNVTMEKCVQLVKEKLVGACITQGQCKMVTKKECNKLQNATFYQDKDGTPLLCTAPQLHTNCTKTTKTICVEGKDEVYFQDSCGNRANIYNSDKYNDIDYWNRIYTKNQSCSPGSGNANSKTCGNCDRFLGGFCASADKSKISPQYGDYICKSTSCVDKDGNTRKNGESWCVYDGKVDNINSKGMATGKDSVGSRHFKQVCNMGVVQVEPCADYRQEICTETKKTVHGKEISYAECAFNPWRSCVGVDSKAGINGECDGKICSKKVVAIDKFHFESCTPLWPPGFQLVSGNSSGGGTGAPGAKSNSDICGTASQSCTVIYIKEISGCKCKINCGCEEQEFSDGMNEICRSLGDCGGYVNWLGKYTSGGYQVINAPAVSLSKKYQSYAKPLKIGEQIIEPFYNISGKSYKIAAFSGGNPNAPKTQNIFGVPPAVAIAAGSMIGVGIVTAILFPMMPGFIFAGVLIIAAIILFVIFLLLGIGKVCKKVVVNFKCMQWARPKGCAQADADKCNADPLKPCSEYRCKSIGAACRIVNKGSSNEKCVPQQDDGIAVKISVDMNRSTDEGKYVSVSDSGFSIKKNGDSCIQAYKTLDLGITTNKLAQCKYDFENVAFDQIGYSFGAGGNDSDGEYGTVHLGRFFLPEPSHIIAYNPETGEYKEDIWNGDVTLYVKCSDVWGRENANNYIISSCITPGPDVTPPNIIQTAPATNLYIGSEITTKTVNFYVNEPADCSWSTTDGSYESMENNMTCTNDIGEITEGGYLCTQEFPTTPVEQKNFKFYVKCKDQPWLAYINESSELYDSTKTRNTMPISYVYELKRVESPITIDSVSFNPEPNANGEIPLSTDTGKVSVSVSTSGGAEKHTCKYSLTGYEEMFDFYSTGTKIHTQELDNLLQGAYVVYVECTDETGDSVRKEASFSIIRDLTPPSMIPYSDKVITSEEADCRSSTEACPFNFENGISMQSGFTTQHNAPGTGDYSIICKDVSGNEMSCAEVTFI